MTKPEPDTSTLRQLLLNRVRASSRQWEGGELHDVLEAWGVRRGRRSSIILSMVTNGSLARIPRDDGWPVYEATDG